MGKTIARDSVFPKILKAQRYRCARCGVKNDSWVYKKASGEYEQLDDFEREHARNAGFRIFKLHLRLNFVDGVVTNFSFHNMLALCPSCTAKHLSQLKRDYKAEALGKLSDIEVQHISIIKNFFANELAITIDTRNVLRVVSLISTILENGNKK